MWCSCVRTTGQPGFAHFPPAWARRARLVTSGRLGRCDAIGQSVGRRQDFYPPATAGISIVAHAAEPRRQVVHVRREEMPVHVVGRLDRSVAHPLLDLQRVRAGRSSLRLPDSASTSGAAASRSGSEPTSKRPGRGRAFRRCVVVLVGSRGVTASPFLGGPPSRAKPSRANYSPATPRHVKIDGSSPHPCGHP